VHEFESGDFLHRIELPCQIVNIVHDTGSRVFMLLVNKAVLCLDYENGQTYSYIRIPQISNIAGARMAWDRGYRRMLVAEYTPDNEDGTATTHIRGFRYRDVPTHLCKPIPLTRLRDGVKSPVLVKQIGDLGEGLAGLVTMTSTETAGHVIRTDVALDGDGEGRGEVLGIDEDIETISLTAEVTCLL
jgi:hypothetical protein